jgi:hypothetical protein
MSQASAWLIRLSMLHLVAGTAIGSLMLTGRSFPALSWAFALRPMHQDVLLAGWMLQLVFGVAFWILPRLPERRREEGTPRLLVSALLLNAGALLGACGGVIADPGVTAWGRAFQLGAALLFATIAWPRVRRYGMVSPVSARGGH